MSFSAKLIVDGGDMDYVVRRFSWGLRQQTDLVGRPDARVQGGQLQVEIDSVPDELLHHWALDDTKKLSGKLIVATADDGSAARKTITFTDAYCVGLNKLFDGSASTQPMTMTLTLSADKLQSGGVLLDNMWPLF
ncbi:MAG: hypothetical protein EOO56_28545 [Hymenobacter sp.]|nr:MAG: hypothetical protein EOO56_28545 [Hymenobacter sp.]